MKCNEECVCGDGVRVTRRQRSLAFNDVLICPSPRILSCYTLKSTYYAVTERVHALSACYKEEHWGHRRLLL